MYWAERRQIVHLRALLESVEGTEEDPSNPDEVVEEARDRCPFRQSLAGDPDAYWSKFGTHPSLESLTSLFDDHSIHSKDNV